MIEAHLDDSEIEYCRNHALHINKKNRGNSVPDKMIGDNKNHELETLGYCAELAVRKAMGFEPLFNRYKFTKGEPDVGHLHVRSTSHPYGHLAIYRRCPAVNSDGRPAPYVLVVRENPNWFNIVGWGYKGELCNDDRYWNEKRGAFWIPQSALYTPEALLLTFTRQNIRADAKNDKISAAIAHRQRKKLKKLWSK